MQLICVCARNKGKTLKLERGLDGLKSEILY